MLNLIKAFRTDENTVKVMYLLKDQRQEFVVEWSNIHAGTGEVENYDLQIGCLSQTVELNEKVENAIREGEKDDSELYHAIMDTFDRMDCEGLH